MPTPIPEIMVTVNKVDASSRVGLGLSAIDGNCLRIVKVDNEGLIPNWNMENPTQRVQRGDRIIEVNGHCGDTVAMIQACKNDVTLQILVRSTADIEQRHRMMQYRNLLPEDFELLGLLDELPSKRTCLRESVIAQLPKRKASSCNIDVCSICLIEPEEDAEMTQLPCQHCFCTKCIEHWLTRCRIDCPMCLTPVECLANDDQASTRASSFDESSGAEDICRESEDDCLTLVNTSLLTPKIMSATRCAGLGSRVGRPS